jgi:predicted nuclease with TOPRIM domain
MEGKCYTDVKVILEGGALEIESISYSLRRLWKEKL